MTYFIYIYIYNFIKDKLYVMFEISRQFCFNSIVFASVKESLVSNTRDLTFINVSTISHP